MYPSQFAHLNQAEPTKADSAQAAARRAIRGSGLRTSRPGIARFASRVKRVAPHFTSGRAHPKI